jgi:dTDP-L-rhamnose 4-epimerase
MPSDESVVNPCNQYALSKHSQEQIALELGKRYEIPSVVLRYSIVQGPRQSVYNAYSGAMRIFALSLMQNRAPTIYEDGRQVRDFVNIGDVVRANLQVLESHGADYRVFNVGGGKAWTIIDFYNKMQEITGRFQPPRIGGDYRFGDTRHIVSDIQQLRELGWEPRRPVEESIEQYWHFLTHQHRIDGILDAAENEMRRQQVIRCTHPADD